MPDITMCKDNSCPMKDNCYRHTAKPNPRRQSYFIHSPRKNQECDLQWPLEKKLNEEIDS